MANRLSPTVVLILVVMVVLGAGLISSTFFTVDAREFAVVTQFGREVATHTEPGLYMKWPSPIQSVTRFDRRIQLYQTRLVEYLTGDKKNIIVQAYVCWRITDPLEFFRSVRTAEIADQRLDDIISALIASTLGEYNMSNLFSINTKDVKTEEMETNILEGANAKVARNFGVEIVSMGFSRLALPDVNARSVYSRMEAERATIASQYRAQGEEEAAKIEAEADWQRSDIVAEAYKEAEILRGEGDARAAEIYGEAYGRYPEFFDLIRTLDSYKQILTQNTTVILSADSDLFRFLNAKGATAATAEMQVRDVR